MLLCAALMLVCPHVFADVVINEIMFHPVSDDDGDEFIELYNPGAEPIDLSGWCFDGVEFCFPAAQSLVAGGYLVLAADSAKFEAVYGFVPDHVYTLVLDNNGERVALLDPALAVVDEVTYEDAGEWPVTPDGLGPSLGSD